MPPCHPWPPDGLSELPPPRQFVPGNLSLAYILRGVGGTLTLLSRVTVDTCAGGVSPRSHHPVCVPGRQPGGQLCPWAESREAALTPSQAPRTEGRSSCLNVKRENLLGEQRQCSGRTWPPEGPPCGRSQGRVNTRPLSLPSFQAPARAPDAPD